MTALLSRLSVASLGLLLAQSAWGAVLVREPFDYEPPGKEVAGYGGTCSFFALSFYRAPTPSLCTSTRRSAAQSRANPAR